MPDKTPKFYLTTPIYYVNARPHIGHAYTTIVADVLARRHRLLGDETWFLTGTDEHGQKIERSAAVAGIAPQQFTDQVSAEFSNLWKRMGITNDEFIRTTSVAHKRGVQKLFTKLYERGHIYLSSYTGQYSIGEEMFVEGPPGTIGPDGKPTETVTEENFFFRLSDFQLPLLDLIESDTLKITPEARKNEVLSFLRGNISASSTPGGRSLPSETQDDSIVNSAKADLPKTALGTSYVPGALKDLSISRSSFTWGIPVPEEIQNAAGAAKPHIVYVWLDALANYITALGYGSDDESQFDKFWPADLHLVGKEIIRFHCVYWPAFLLAAGLPLPKAISAHGWLLFDDAKMSKSKGNIVRTETILEAFGSLTPAPPQPSDESNPAILLSSRSEAEGSASSTATTTAAKLKDTASAVPSTQPEHTASAAEAISPSIEQRDLFAADVLRYFLLREIPFGQDGSFTFDALLTRYNADLANGYGNLVSRVLGMIQQNFSVGLQKPSEPWLCADRHAYWGEDKPTEQFEDKSGTRFIITEIIRYCKFSDLELWPTNRYQIFLAELILRIGHVDAYLSFHKPWLLAKSSEPTDRQKLVEVLYTAAESIRIITALLYPILPYATASVWRQLGLGDIEDANKNGELKNLQWGGLLPGTKLGPLSPIFPRADKGLAQIMIDMEAQKNQQQSAKRDANDLLGANNSTTAARPEFGDAAVASEAGAQSTPPPTATTHPGAAPRTGGLPEFNPGAQVGGSTATNPERGFTPPHAEAPASGIFAAQNAQGGPADASPQITIDDFAKVELRVARVLVCERIPKADKLLRLEVDLGYERRQILSGIAEWYTPEDLIGRRIVVITNLAPRKMRGLESHGMLLAASGPEGGKPVLATFADSDAEALPLGSRLK